MIVLTSIVSIAVFISALWVFGVVRVSSDALVSTREAVAVMRDESLDDAAREKAVRRASLRLLGAFLSILVRSALAFAASLLPIWLAARTGIVRTEEVFRYLARWDVILTSSVILTVGYVIWIRIRPSR